MKSALVIFNAACVVQRKPACHAACRTMLCTCLVVVLGSLEARLAGAQIDGAQLHSFVRYGGAGPDHLLDARPTRDGTIWVLGATKSPEMGSCAGAFQDRLASTRFDAFLQQWDERNGNLVNCTFLGGTGTDADPPEVTVSLGDLGPTHGLCVGPDGSAYATVATQSTNFPTTAGAFQRVHAGRSDVAVVKVSSDGRLVWSTLIGGTDFDVPQGVLIRQDGSVVVWGATRSEGLGTRGAYQSTYRSEWDGFVACLEPDGGQLRYFTYLGGRDFECLTDVEVLPDGSLLVTGTTTTPTTLFLSAAIRRGPGGGRDAFLVHMSPAGDSLRKQMRLGGSSLDAPHDLAILEDGDILVVGATKSHDFPRDSSVGSVGPVDANMDAFWAIIDADLADVIKAVTFGGTETDVALAAASLPGRRATITGLVSSPIWPFPVNVDAPWPTSKGGKDGFVTLWDLSTGRLEWSSLVSGSSYDVATSASLAPSGRLLVAGTTRSSSTSLPTRAAPGQQWSLGAGLGGDVFLLSLSLTQSTSQFTTIDGCAPRRLARSGSVTLVVSGANLLDATVWTLVDQGEHSFTPSIERATQTEVILRFDLRSAEPGPAQIIALNDGVELARHDGCEIIDEDCQGPLVEMHVRPSMRAGDPRRPNVLTVTFRNPCGQDIFPTLPFNLVFDRPDVVLTPRSSFTTPTRPGLPTEPSPPLALSDGENTVASLIPESLPAGASKSWITEFYLPDPPPGENRPDPCDERKPRLTVTGSTIPRYRPCWESIADVATSTLVDLYASTFGECISAAADALVTGAQFIRDSADRRTSVSDDTWNFLGFLYSATKGVAVCSPFARATAAIRFALLASFTDKASQWLTNAGVAGNCLPLVRQLYSDIRYACDPNAIYGPMGSGALHHTNVSSDLNYTVLFENSPLASGPATEVFLDIPLDPTRFALASVRLDALEYGSSLVDLSSLAAGDTIISAVAGRPDLVLLTVFHLDHPRSTLHVELLTREADGMGVPPVDGFLPPNNDDGDGEGAVRFVVDLLPGVVSGTTFSAQATITFDLNPPIETNFWTNHFDATPPTASITPPIAPGLDAVSVSWSSADEHSGVASAIVLGRYSDGRVAPVAEGSPVGAAQIRVGTNSPVALAVACVDSAGNSYEPPADAFLSIPPPFTERALSLSPNPARAQLGITLLAPAGTEAVVHVYNVAGQRVATPFAGTLDESRLVLTWPLLGRSGDRVPPGVYFVQARIGAETRSRRFVILSQAS